VKVQSLPNAVGPERTDAPIYFLHIPKTAGSTLCAFLESLFLNSEFWHRGAARNWENLLKLTPEQLRCCQIINGHFAGYFFKYYPLPLRYFTYVREPLARAVSHYEHVLRNKAHYFHTIAHELGSFGAYLRDARTQPTVVNFQLRCLGATIDPVEIAKTLTPEQITRRELERYLDSIPLTQPVQELMQTAEVRLEQMCFVGLTERFEESLALLCEIFGWPRSIALEARNVNPRGISVKDLPSADVRLLNRLNEADIELYQRAKGRFERDWARSRFVYPHLHAFISYAQNAEDVLLYRVLRDVSHGTYVDVGANDPAGDSVTKAFYDRGWRGINIEPVTSLYESLVKQRPEDLNIQAAAGAAAAKKTLYEIPGTGLSTLDASIADHHRNHGFKVNETRVRVRTLRSILAKARRSVIHFLKIDVEGWERAVLQGMDLTTTRPWIIVVEATKPNTETASYREWEPLLLKHGYSFVFFDGLNRYYLAREKGTLKKAFSHPVNSGDVFLKASEASAVRALRDAQWNLRRQSILLREHERSLAEVNTRAESAQAHANALERERDALRQEVATHANSRDVEREEAIRQIDALSQWATSADAYGKSLVGECEGLRVALKAANDAREAERVEAIRQVEALTQWATSADAYGKSLVGECEGLRVALKAANDAREAERVEAIRQVAALTERAESADALAKPRASECAALRVTLKDITSAREAERVEAIRQIEAMTGRAASADASAKLLVSECEGLRVALKAANDAREAERVEAIRHVETWTERAASANAYGAAIAAELEQWREKWHREGDAHSADQESSRQRIQELTVLLASASEYANSLLGELAEIQKILKDERESRALEQADLSDRAEHLLARIATLEQELADGLALQAQLQSALRREQSERRAASAAWSDERNTLEASAQALAELLQRAENKVDALGTQLKVVLENQTRSMARWQVERNDLDNSLIALEGCLTKLQRHWAVRLLVSQRYLSRIWGN
jgi:FkbM family methyltransferase